MILIAIGSNLPVPGKTSPIETCIWAVETLSSLPGLSAVALSRWFTTAPDPPSSQPDYINGVLRMSGEIGPEELLAKLNAIECAAGRVRSHPNAARTLDLDIIAMGDAVRAAPDPILPHPRAHVRRFVLLPLSDVAPDWHHPVLGESVATLLARLPPSPIRPLVL